MPASTLPPIADSPPPSELPARKGERALFWKVAGVLIVLAVVGSAAVVPYALALSRQMDIEIPPNVPPSLFWTLVMGINACFEVVISVGAIILGLWLGRGIGLGAPLLSEWVEGNPAAPPRVARSLVPALIGGVLVAIALLTLERLLKSWVPRPARHFVAPGIWSSLLASVGAGIREEVWMRLGLLTLFAWIGTKIARQPRPGVVNLWIANAVAALLFGMIHLPQAASLAGPLTPQLAAYVLLLNGIGGLVFGWVYWRYGLLAAMFSHFSADLVAKVVWPLIHTWVG
jgi:hypothetical protein